MSKEGTTEASWRAEDRFDDADLFVLGNTLFTLYHELGHALIDILDLPVIGREEDAVDGFAALMMIPEQPDRLRDELIVAVADGWRLQSDRFNGERRFWSKHALDEQRHFRIVCLMVGSDQDGFFDFARDAGLPPSRIESCVDDFSRMKTGWRRLLDPHHPAKMTSEEFNDRAIQVIFDEPERHHRHLERLIREHYLLEDAMTRIEDLIAMPSMITVRFASCREANAYWESGNHEVSVCYELIEEFNAILSGVPIDNADDEG